MASSRDMMVLAAGGALGYAVAKAMTASPASDAGNSAVAAPQKVHRTTHAPHKKKLKVCVFGSGSFGTAMAVIIARNGHTVVMLTRRDEVAASINDTHHHAICFTGYELPPNLTATTDPRAALDQADFIVHCIPVQSSRTFLANLKALIPPTTPIISTSKGLDVSTLEMMSSVIPSALGRDQPRCYLSGPSFAKELLDKTPTGVVMASASIELTAKASNLFSSNSVRVYPSTDVIGVEIGGALKNVFAIAAGACEGMGLGLNTAALLVTRGCNEMMLVSVALGARPDTVNGLSGIGDLMLTCFGKLSRNRTVGQRLGKGETLKEILATSKEVAEGVATTPAASELAAKLGVRTPIIHAMAALIKGDLTARETLLELMNEPVYDEEA